MSARRKSAPGKAARPKRSVIGELAIENAMLEHIVEHARHQIATGGERLAELGECLQDIGGLPLSAEPSELRRAGVRAQADCTQAIVGLMSAMVSAERIALLASLRELAEPHVEKEESDV